MVEAAPGMGLTPPGRVRVEVKVEFELSVWTTGAEAMPCIWGGIGRVPLVLAELPPGAVGFEDVEGAATGSGRERVVGEGRTGLEEGAGVLTKSLLLMAATRAGLGFEMELAGKAIAKAGFGVGCWSVIEDEDEGGEEDEDGSPLPLLFPLTKSLV